VRTVIARIRRTPDELYRYLRDIDEKYQKPENRQTVSFVDLIVAGGTLQAYDGQFADLNAGNIGGDRLELP